MTLTTFTSNWEAHSSLCQEVCACGGEISFVLSEFHQPTADSLTEKLTGKCQSCGEFRSISFSHAIDLQNPNLDSLSPESAWPPARSSPYPMAEQKLPKFDMQSEELNTFSLNGRWQIIGKRSGSMGSVYLCVDKNDSRSLAVCKLPLQISEEDAHLKECNFYQDFTWRTGQRSSHVLDVYDIQSTGIGMQILVLQAVMPGPENAITVADWIRCGKVTPDLAMAWTAHIATGLLHCQQLVPGFVHADLKPDNLLVDIGWICKLSDFGLSGSQTIPATSGAPLYRAPELWDAGGVFSTASDVYSLGCIAYELFTGKQPYTVNDHDPDTMEYAHRSQAPRTDERVPPLIFRCLDKTAKNRPTLAEIIDSFPHRSTRSTMVSSKVPLAELINRAAAQLSMGKPAKAIEILSPHVSTEHEGILAHLAMAFSQLGNYKAADMTYALLAQQRSLADNLNYAAHLHRSNKLEEALTIATGAVNANRRSIAARINASAILNDLGRFSEALEHLKIAKDIDPGHATVLYQLTYTNLKLGNYSPAKKLLDKLITLNGTTDYTRLLAELGHELYPKLFTKPA